MNFRPGTDARHDTGDAPSPAEVPSDLGEAMANYRTLLEELEAGRIDDATFRKRALHVGLIVREHDAWILDLSTERWWRYDGVALSSLRFRETGV